MRVWLILLISLVLVGGLAACTGKDAGNGTDTDPAQVGGSSNWANAFEEGRFDPPLTLTTVVGLDPNAAIFKQGETIEDNVHTRLVKERLGIDIKYEWVVTNTNDAYKTKLRLMLSSGEKMPDVVRFRGDLETVNMLIDSGQFMPVDELIERYAGEE